MNSHPSLRQSQPRRHVQSISNMKTTTTRKLLLPLAIASLCLSGCGNKVLDYRNAQVVNGKIYAKEANEPFSGKITNLPEAIIITSSPGLQRLVAVIRKISPNASLVNATMRAAFEMRGADESVASLFSGAPGTPPVFCDAGIDQGVLDGSITCTQSDETVLEASADGGSLDGKLTAWSNGDGHHTDLVAKFSHGQPDGKVEVYSSDTHRLIHTLTFSDGTLNGPEEGFDASTGNRILQGNNANGLIEGKLSRWDVDGKELPDITFNHGVPQTQETPQAPSNQTIADPGPSSDEIAHQVEQVSHDAQSPAPASPTSVQTNNSQATSPDTSNQPAPSAPAIASLLADGPAVKRCGWIENDMPSSLTLKDRDGTWNIVGGQASGEPAGFDQMPPTDKGDSCGCLTVQTNRQSMQIIKIFGGELKPVSACQQDKSLK